MAMNYCSRVKPRDQMTTPYTYTITNSTKMVGVLGPIITEKGHESGTVVA